MQPGRVQLGVVNEEQDEEAGQTLVVQQLPAPELAVTGGCQHRSSARPTGSPAHATPEVAPSASSAARVDGEVRAQSVDGAAEDGGEGGAAALADVAEEPLVHCLAAVPLLVVTPQVLSLGGEV